MFDRSHPNNLFTCSQDGGLWHWDVNDTSSQAHSLPRGIPSSTLQLQHPLSRHGTPKAPPTSQKYHLPGSFIHQFDSANEKDELGSNTSTWLSGTVQHGKVHVENYSPGQGFSVNSLDIESRHLVCGTDGEAMFLIPDLTLR